jgi:hypothetical protein
MFRGLRHVHCEPVCWSIFITTRDQTGPWDTTSPEITLGIKFGWYSCQYPWGFEDTQCTSSILVALSDTWWYVQNLSCLGFRTAGVLYSLIPPVSIFVHISIDKMGMWLAYTFLWMGVCTNATTVCFVEGCGLLHYVLRNGNSTITRQPWRVQRNEKNIVQSCDRYFVLLLIFCASMQWLHGNHEYVLLTCTPRARSYVLFYRHIYFCHHNYMMLTFNLSKRSYLNCIHFQQQKNEYDVHIYWLILQSWLAPLQILL